MSKNGNGKNGNGHKGNGKQVVHNICFGEEIGKINTQLSAPNLHQSTVLNLGKKLHGWETLAETCENFGKHNCRLLCNTAKSKIQ
ncbi:MAG: hypothetical protein FWE50_03015 [Alphaproteobacteria bacterium]|nr:hypothetical protein [Alphaproteobacteria bacterium]